MSTKLNDYLSLIQQEKNTKIIPENIKKGIRIFGIDGICEGSNDATTNIYIQKNEPTEKKGLWIQAESDAVPNLQYLTNEIQTTIEWETEDYKTLDFSMTKTYCTYAMDTNIYIFHVNNTDKNNWLLEINIYDTINNNITQLEPVALNYSGSSLVGIQCIKYSDNIIRLLVQYQSQEFIMFDYDMTTHTATTIDKNISTYMNSNKNIGYVNNKLFYTYNYSQGKTIRIYNFDTDESIGSDSNTTAKNCAFVPLGNNMLLTNTLGLNKLKNVIAIVNSNTLTIKELTTMPEILKDASAISLGTHLVLLDATYTADSTTGEITSSPKYFLYSLLDNSFTKFTDFPLLTTNVNISYAVTGNYIYIFSDTSVRRAKITKTINLTNNTVGIIKGPGYETELIDGIYSEFLDVIYYVNDELLDVPMYYGNGEEWIHFKNK